MFQKPLYWLTPFPFSGVDAPATAGGLWTVTEARPVVQLLPESGACPEGWCRLDLSLSTQGDTTPLLLVENAAGVERIALAPARRGKIHAIVRLSQGARALFLQPGQAQLDFRLGPMTLRPISRSEAGLRLLAALLLDKPGQLIGLLALARKGGLRAVIPWLMEQSRRPLPAPVPMHSEPVAWHEVVLPWPEQSGEGVDDIASAARFCLDLLRRRPDLRARFPQALSDGAAGEFAQWLQKNNEPGLSPPGLAALAQAFEQGLGDRPRQLWLTRSDLRDEFPLGLLPERAFLRWLWRWGVREAGLQPEEIGWFALAALESPAREMRRIFLFTPAWQAVAAGGQDLAAWLQARYGLDQPWADPANWPREEPPEGPGVNLLGHFCYPSGLRTATLALAEGLAQAGLAVSKRDVPSRFGDDEPHHGDFAGLEIYDSTILHVQPEPFFDDVYARAGLAEASPRRYRIGYWYWELDEIPASWQRQAAQLDELWAATNFVAGALRQRFTLPVCQLPPGVSLPAFQLQPRAAFGLTQDRFTFLFVFHMMSIMERKNPLGLIKAFRQAFAADEPVNLVLKTSFGPDHPAALRELKQAAAENGITVIDAVFSQSETLALIQSCDCYISLHRSEGFGLTMAEAMLLGRPVIATGYSGNTDFMDSGNSLLVDYRLVPLARDYPPYAAGAHWAEPSLDHAARLMRQVYENQDWAKHLGQRARRDLSEKLSPSAAGRRMAARLAEIRARR